MPLDRPTNGSTMRTGGAERLRTAVIVRSKKGGFAGKRRVPDSNGCTGFCRPVPNHSANAPGIGS